MPNITIDPSNPNLSTDDKKILLTAIQNKTVMIYEKNKMYVIGNDNVTFTHHLIRSTERPPADVFHVPENKTNIGQGAFSKFRSILVEISTDANSNLLIKKPDKKNQKVLRVSNPKNKNTRDYNPSYDHQKTVSLYKKEKIYPHLNVEEPIRVTKTNKSLEKSYTLMNRMKGFELHKESKAYLDYTSPTTLKITTEFIIPLLIAYRDQVQKLNMVHRDIKPPNIMADNDYEIKTKKSAFTFSFIDIDQSVAINTIETGKYGTVGYTDPALLESDANSKTYIATTARDIFSLGALLIGSINYNLDIGEILANNAQDLSEAYNLSHQLTDTSLNPILLINKLAEDPDSGYFPITTDQEQELHDQFFEMITPSSNDPTTEFNARNEILDIIKRMTMTDIKQRYQNIDDVIKAFEAVANLLSPQLSTTAQLSSALGVAPGALITSPSTPATSATSSNQIPPPAPSAAPAPTTPQNPPAQDPPKPKGP